MLCIFLTAAMAAAAFLPSCSNTQDEISSSKEVFTTSSENINSVSMDITEQVFSFQINSSLPVYKCIAYITDNEHKQISKIEIIEEKTEKSIQTIVPKSNDLFTNSAVYFADLTFTGNLSLIIPYERSSHYAAFDAYIWDDAERQFVEAPSFKNIHNPAIDSQNKRILSKNSASQITSYNMFSYKDDEFILTNSVYWQPSSLESSKESSMQRSNHFIEKNGDVVVLDIHVPGNDPYTIDISNPQISPYFVSGSFWDLGSEKWQCMFLNEFIS